MHFTLGERVILETDKELLESSGASEGNAEVVDYVLEEIVTIVEVQNLAVLRKWPTRWFLALDVALIHEDGQFFERQPRHLLQDLHVLLLSDQLPLHVQEESLKEGTLSRQAIQQVQNLLHIYLSF